MPLERLTEEPVEVSGNVQFTMLNGAERIVCTVSQEALAGLAVKRNAASAERLAAFRQFRSAIESKASAIFDAGAASPMVRWHHMFA